MNFNESVIKIKNTIFEARVNRGQISSLKEALILENEVNDMLQYTSSYIKELSPELKEFVSKKEWNINEDLEDHVIKDAYLYTSMIGIEKEEEVLGERKIWELLEKYDNKTIGDYVFLSALNEIFWILYSKVNKYAVAMPYEWLDVFVCSIDVWKRNTQYLYHASDVSIGDTYNITPLYFLVGFDYVMDEYFNDNNSYNTNSPNTDIETKIWTPVIETAPNMNPRELENREKRLRRAAAKKGLFIKKRKWRLYYSQYNYDSFDGYCVGTVETGLIIWGENEAGINAPTLEEAEEIVANYRSNPF